MGYTWSLVQLGFAFVELSVVDNRITGLKELINLFSLHAASMIVCDPILLESSYPRISGL
jgi:hypothetical protein